MIGRRLAHYEIVAKLGEGGMGVVYKARDTQLDRFVAIKVLTAEATADVERRRRFVQEAKAASALNHPGIVAIYGISSEEGTDFIAMEYVDGQTLDQLIRGSSLRIPVALRYAIQAAGALAKAHSAGIVHRDIKPSNIMVTTDGVVKVLDFGVAKLVAVSSPADDSSDTRTGLHQPPRTQEGRIVGTAAYMSPEQAAGQQVDARSDIFSFGTVLYEMVTGARAFGGPSSVSTLAAVLTAEPKPPSEVSRDVPTDFERIILRCLRKDPAKRFQVTSDVVVELEEITAGSGTLPLRRRARLPGHRPVLVMAVASAGGGEATQMTDAGGAGVWDSWDGQTLFYSRHDGNGPEGLASAVFARSINGGPERKVLDGVFRWDFFPVKDGIYYIALLETRRYNLLELRFLTFATGKTRVLSRFRARASQGLSVSADGKTIFYSGRAPGPGADLMLIQNFR